MQSSLLCILPGTEPTYRKTLVFQSVVDNLTIKSKRRLFKLMRESKDMDVGSFFPLYGLTAGEFSTWYILGGAQRRSVK
jgi:hypothetical protein